MGRAEFASTHSSGQPVAGQDHVQPSGGAGRADTQHRACLEWAEVDRSGHAPLRTRLITPFGSPLRTKARFSYLNYTLEGCN